MLGIKGKKKRQGEGKSNERDEIKEKIKRNNLE